MTGLGVERMPRAAFPPPSESPAGVGTPLPPLIQGAERRTGRTGLRWGLRALVIGGLAGAAWLLTGAAAHAADRVDGPIGSLLGAVVESDTTAPVTGLLTAAARPLEIARPAHHKHHVVTDVIDVPRRVLTRPARTLDDVTHGHSGTPVDAAIGGADLILREVAGPLRLTGGPTATHQRLTAATAPVTRIPRPAVAPARAVAGPDPAAATSRTTIGAPATSRSTITAAAMSRSTITAVRAPAAAVLRTAALVRHGKTASPVRHGKTDRGEPAAHAVTAAPATEDTSGGDGPAAPGRLHLGSVSGTPTSWSGTPTEGGSAAFLPAAIVSSTMACQRLPIASDVEVRRTDAEAPTVSPD